MSFTQYEYFVHENESYAEICLEIVGFEGATQAGLWLDIYTTDNTSVGKLRDSGQRD